MKADMDKPLGQIALEAYAESAGWKALGHSPKWRKIKSSVKAHWTAAAKAVEEEVKTSESVPHET